MSGGVRGRKTKDPGERTGEERMVEVAAGETQGGEKREFPLHANGRKSDSRTLGETATLKKKIWGLVNMERRMEGMKTGRKKPDIGKTKALKEEEQEKTDR